MKKLIFILLFLPLIGWGQDRYFVSQHSKVLYETEDSSCYMSWGLKEVSKEEFHNKDRSKDSTYVKHNSQIPKEAVYPVHRGDPDAEYNGWLLKHNLKSFSPMEELIIYWKQYKQECFNDSTAYLCYKRANRDSYTLELYGYDTCYLHSEPNIEGFMSFIEKQLK